MQCIEFEAQRSRKQPCKTQSEAGKPRTASPASRSVCMRSRRGLDGVSEGFVRDMEALKSREQVCKSQSEAKCENVPRVTYSCFAQSAGLTHRREGFVRDMEAQRSRKQPRFLPLLLALALLLCPAAYAASDAPAEWAAEEVGAVEALGIVPKELQTDYDQPITRGEFAAVAAGYLSYIWNTDLQILAWELENIFSDQLGSYEWEICIAAHFGVLNGYEDGTFRPDQEISRQEAAVILSRMVDLLWLYDPENPDKGLIPPVLPDYTDTNAIGDWAAEGVAHAADLGLMQGLPDGRFDPLGTYTREQSYATMARLYQYVDHCLELDYNMLHCFPAPQCIDALQLQAATYTSIQPLTYNDDYILYEAGSWGHMQAFTDYYVIYQSGGMRRISAVLPQNIVITPFSFFEDNRLLIVDQNATRMFSLNLDTLYAVELPQEPQFEADFQAASADHWLTLAEINDTSYVYVAKNKWNDTACSVLIHKDGGWEKQDEALNTDQPDQQLLEQITIDLAIIQAGMWDIEIVLHETEFAVISGTAQVMKFPEPHHIIVFSDGTYFRLNDLPYMTALHPDSCYYDSEKNRIVFLSAPGYDDPPFVFDLTTRTFYTREQLAEGMTND